MLAYGATLDVTYSTRYIWYHGFSTAKSSGKHYMINLEGAFSAIATDNSNRPSLLLGARCNGNGSRGSPDV